jgi:ABC-2 type transport system ATP-binding protein
MATPENNLSSMIRAEKLSKAYRIRQQRPGLQNGLRALFKPDYVTVPAVDRISFDIPPGTIAGLIGPNGAGKSTLVKLLVGIMQRDSGNLVVNGLDPFLNRKTYVQRIGVVFGQRSNLLWDLSVEEAFELHRAIFQIPRNDYRARRDELIEIFELADIIHQPARTLSLGQTMRCAVAQVLLQQPDILFLDEPTIGLDVRSVDRLGTTLQRLNKTLNTTVVITSHDLAVIEGVCTQILLLERGRIIFDGTAGHAIDKYGRYRKLRFVFTPGVDLDAMSALLKSRGVDATRDGTELAGVVDVESGGVGRNWAPLIDELTHKHRLQEFFFEKPSLKEVILHAFR